MKPVLLMLGTLLLAAPAWAQDAAPLPDEAAVRQALRASPAVQTALHLADYEEATRRRLDAGPYEWTLRAGLARRDEVGATRYAEHDFGVERGTRWWWKGATDRRIGEQGLAVADAAIADAWHEEGRGLLALWFEVLRGAAAVEHLQGQLALVEEQHRGVARRVEKGEARPLDLRLSETDLAMMRARLQQAQQDAANARLSFGGRYPGLLPSAAAALPEPPLPARAEDGWYAEIVGHNHEIELVEAEARRLQLQAERARQERLPDPLLGSRYAYERSGNERVLGLSVSLPLGWSNRAAAADQALARAGEAQERVREVRRRVETAARTVAREAASRYAVWQSLQQVASNARRNAEALARGYALGESTLSEALLARRQALESSLAAASAAADAWEAHARLRLDAHEIWAYEQHHVDCGAACADGGTAEVSAPAAPAAPQSPASPAG